MNVFELFKESYGVGVVASKKQAKDPRYSHSLTKDVRPDTPKKNQRALGLTEAEGRQSDDDKYLLSLLAQIGAAEGKYFGQGSQNPDSSARGRYQFTKKTWEGIQNNIRNGVYKNYGIDQQLLDDIANTSHQDMSDVNNPDFSKRIQDAAALIGAKENARRLEREGINVDRDNLYKTWALGPSTGIKVIQAKGTGKSMEDIYKEVYGTDSRDEDGNLKWEKQLKKTKKQNPTWFAKGDSADAIGGHLNDHIAKLNKGKTQPEVTVAVTPQGTADGEDERQALIKKITGQQNKITGVDTDPNARGMVDQLYKMYPNTREGRLQARKDLSTYRRTGTMPTAPVPVASNEKPAQTDVTDLAKANNIKDADKITVGQKIKMPDGSEITVKPGDTLSKITKAYNDKQVDRAKNDAINAELGGADVAGATPTGTEEKPSVDAETKARNGAIEAMQKQMQTALTNKDPDLYVKSVKALQAIPGVTPEIVARVQSGKWTNSEYEDVADAFGSEEDAKLQDKQQEELGKTYAERGRDDLNKDRLEKEEAELKRLQTELEYAGTEDAFGGERQSKEEVDAQKKELKQEIDVKKRAIAFIKDPGITSDGGGSMTPEQLEFLKAKEKEKLEIETAKEQGREPNPALIGNKSVGELELDAARAYRYAAQAEKEGRKEEAAAARKEADANMKVRQDMVDLGVTWMSGAGNPDQAQRTIDDVKAGNTTGINLFQKPEGKEREQFQQNQAEADRQDAEQGEGAWDRTSTLDDEKKKVDPTPIDKREPEVEPEVEPKVEPELPKSTTAAKTSYSGSVASAGGATSKGGGYGQGAEVDATVSVTPKEDPYPNPGYEGEELRIYNQLSDSQKEKIIRDHEKYKQNQANLNKNANVRSGPPARDPESLKPRSLLDIKHQQQLSGIEGGTQLVDPAKATEVSKILGMPTLTQDQKKARDAALDAVRFKAPSMDELQKGMTPIVDKSINKDAQPKVDTTPVKANVPAANTSANTSAIGQAIQPKQDLQAIARTTAAPMVKPGTNLGKDNASQQAQDLQKQKAEADARKAEQEAAAAKQKAEQEAQAQKQEQERQRQAANNARVGTTDNMNKTTFKASNSGPGLANQFDVRKKVPESAIFRAIMRK